MRKAPSPLHLVPGDHNLNTWKLNWIIDGNRLECAHCRVSQTIEAAGQPFVHLQHCRAHSESPQYPWQELAEILKGMLKSGNI